MRTDYRESNAVHQESIDVYETFIASGGKVTVAPVLKRQYIKGTINKPTPKKDTLKLDGLKNIEKIKRVISKHKIVTRIEIENITGMDKSEIFRCARKLETAGFLTRDSGKGMGGTTTFNLVEK